MNIHSESELGTGVTCGSRVLTTEMNFVRNISGESLSKPSKSLEEARESRNVRKTVAFVSKLIYQCILFPSSYNGKNFTRILIQDAAFSS